MKTIGLIGGISWHSTLDYYRIITEEVNRRTNGNDAARLILNSINYGEIKRLTKADNWIEIASIITHAAKQVAAAGADCVMIGANTMHRVADQVQAAVDIPLIHITDATANEIKKKKLQTIALLGTKYTMQLPFYKERLVAHGIRTIIPDNRGIQMINDSIYDELGSGILSQSTKEKYLQLIDLLVEQGAEGVILGCTEIPLLIKQSDCSIPVFDTTRIHSMAAVEFALSKEGVTI